MIRYLLPALLLLTLPANGQQVPHPAPMSLPATNSALKAISGAINLRAHRLGFAASGDGGYAEYNWSAANCTAADDGAQVQPSVTGCWIADFTNIIPDARVWGATTASANATAALQAAVNARQGASLRIAGGIYKFTALSWTGALTLVSDSAQGGRTGGPGSLPGAQIACIGSGLRQLTANQAAEITPGPGSVIDGLCIDHVGLTNTSGTAISLVGAGAKTVRNTQINGACVAVDISWQDGLDAGTVNNAGYYADRVDILGPADVTGCAGFRVGHASKNNPVGAQTPFTADARISNSNVWCAGGSTNNIGMLIEEAGGLIVEANGIVGCGWGTVVRPGQYQTVDSLNFSNTTIGDTSAHNDLLIETAHATAVIQHVHMVNSWTGSGLAETIKIGGAGGGGIAGIHIAGGRIYARADAPLGQRAIYVTASGDAVKDISIDSSTICAGATSSADYMIVISANARFALRDNTIGVCDRAAADYTVSGGILLNNAGTPTGIISGNMFVGVPGASTLIVSGGATAHLGVANNIGLDDVQGSVASATSIAAPPFPVVTVTGAVAIQNITNQWFGRVVTFVPAPGGTLPAFNVAAGNLCNLITPAAGASVIATFSGASNCWWLK